MPYQIIRNDITRMHVDAIVNPTDAIYSGSGGVDARIHFAAGEQLREACNHLPFLHMGEVSVTDGFDLPCRYVIHTFGPIWHGGNRNEREDLIACYRSALFAAKERDCETIAFPLISSGTFGFPKDQVLRIALEAVTEFLMANDMTVFIVVYDKQAYELSKRLQTDIASYIDANYIARKDLVFDPYTYAYHAKDAVEEAESSVKAQSEKAAVLSSASKNTQSLASMLSEKKPTFAETLFRFIDDRGIKDSECYKRANVDRRVFSKIKSNSDYLPKKETIVSFAVGLQLSLEETKELLGSAGIALRHNSKFDVIIEYFITHNNYDMFEINGYLFQEGQPCLGNVIE